MMNKKDASPEKILVTGGTGLVGSAISNKENYYKLSNSIDLRNPESTNEIFEKVKPDAVIHCAARVGGVAANLEKKGEFFFDNIMINTNVIESARRHGVEKLIAFMSTCIFPDRVSYPLDANKIHRGEPHQSNYPYAYAKRMIDVQIRAYRDQYGLNYTSVIPTNIYGPNDNFDTSNGHVIPSLIHKCYLAKKNGTNFEVWGTGRPLREFIFSKDVAVLTEKILRTYDGGEPIILSTSQEVSIAEVVDIIVRYMRFTGKVEWLKKKPDGQYRKPSNNSLLRDLFPDFEFTSLSEGLGETIGWFEENYKNARR